MQLILTCFKISSSICNFLWFQQILFSSWRSELWIFELFIFTCRFPFIRLTFKTFSQSFIHLDWESIKKLPKFTPKSLKFKDFNFIPKRTVKEFVHSCPGYLKHPFFQTQSCRDAIHRALKQLIYADLFRFFQKIKFFIADSDSSTS